ncbi:thymidylate kinase [Phlyctema vagabunda]|uniref:dTMP kinase n=1 Tax=Phlyctema vagabunda TaxID=108571 RepID=A0ABR4PIG1_9HELO
MAGNTNEGRPWQDPTKSINRGAFIVVEGLDRTGKTTQVQKLADALHASGRNVKAMRFPDRTSPIGNMINNYLQSKTEMEDHVIHLLFSANRWESAKNIMDSLANGYTIICDRYYYSGMIYSAAKDNPALSIQWARGPEVGLPRPDMVVFLNLSPEEAAKRADFGDEKYETSQMQKRVQELYQDLAKVVADESDDLRVINAGGSIDEVASEIFTAVSDRVQQVEQGAEFKPGKTYNKEVRTVSSWNGAWEEMVARKH